MPLSQDEFLKLPIIALQGLQGNRPVHYSTLQNILLPYLDILQILWWICFFTTVAVLITRFLILPLVKQRTNKVDLTCPPFVTDSASLLDPPDSLHTPLARFKAIYRKFFSIREIEQDITLRLYGGAILLGYLATYTQWELNPASTIAALHSGHAVCWPFFQSCNDFVWLQTLPYGYSQTVFFMGMFGLIILAAYGLLARRIFLAHACIFALFIFKIYLTLIAFSYNGNYDYYHNLFNLVFLFLPRKRFFGSLVLVWCYFLSTAVKIHPSWVWGGYFSAMREGLPLVPRGWEAIFTNIVIFMELVMSWFMFSPRIWLQRSVFGFFCFFHLYSGTLVGYHYPTIVMPSLLIFFGPLFRPFSSVPLCKAGIPGWILIACLFGIQLFSHTLPGDTKLTMEGNNYGLYMFEANHQCRVTYSDEHGNILDSYDSTNARMRCMPWEILMHAKHQYCHAGLAEKIHLSIIHSINGGPFYQIVDEPDVCSLSYKAFGRNDWIKDETSAPMIGRPLENYYR